ncbi:MAG TPA: hypothetical protein VGP33_17560 [Chloroflexota bacterium]|nr:hypothetical protein [Chloroflexota bacterium]
MHDSTWGRVAQLAIASGGAPKLPVQQSVVDTLGLAAPAATR